MKIGKLNVGDTVTYKVASPRSDKRLSQATIYKIDTESNRVYMTRRTGTDVVHLTISPSRIIMVEEPT